MKECLWCKEQYEHKKESSKFCSTSCRVMWNRKYGKKKGQLEVNELQDLYNSILTAVNSINAKNGQPPAIASVFVPEVSKEAVLGYNELRELIEAATSSSELHKAWKQVEKNKELVGWQIKILSQLKENQRTKIDF
jgi:hypothetical protein